MTHWTAHDVARLRSLHASADYSDEIAGELLGRSRRAVAIKRQKLGMVTRRCRSRIKSASSYELTLELRRRGFNVTKAKAEPSHSGVTLL